MNTTGPTPTARQAEIFDFVLQRCLNGNPPTIRDIGKRFEIRSPNGVMCHLNALKAKGMIVVESGHARGIRPAVPVLDVTPRTDGRLEVRTTGPVVVTAEDLRRLSEPLRMAA